MNLHWQTIRVDRIVGTPAKVQAHTATGGERIEQIRGVALVQDGQFVMEGGRVLVALTDGGTATVTVAEAKSSLTC